MGCLIFIFQTDGFIGQKLVNAGNLFDNSLIDNLAFNFAIDYNEEYYDVVLRIFFRQLNTPMWSLI